MKLSRKHRHRLTQAAVDHLLVSEWQLPVYWTNIKDQTLEALGVSNTDVNWILHRVEWDYGLDIEQEVPLHTTLQAFMQFILLQRKKTL